MMVWVSTWFEEVVEKKVFERVSQSKVVGRGYWRNWSKEFTTK
jgi:hypothetical protein